MISSSESSPQFRIHYLNMVCFDFRINFTCFLITLLFQTNQIKFFITNFLQKNMLSLNDQMTYLRTIPKSFKSKQIIGFNLECKILNSRATRADIPSRFLPIVSVFISISVICDYKFSRRGLRPKEHVPVTARTK